MFCCRDIFGQSSKFVPKRRFLPPARGELMPGRGGNVLLEVLVYRCFWGLMLWPYRWLCGTAVERRLWSANFSCPALELQLTGDHLCW